MGGSVLIGIRRRSGEIYLAKRWTNPTPYWFNDPDFYAEDERLVQEYIDEPQEEPETPTIIYPSEYGVILVDLINRRVLSRQDYTSVGALHLYFTDTEKVQLAGKLIQAGLVTEVSADPMSDRVTCWGTLPEGCTEIVLDEPKKLRLLKRIQEFLSGDYSTTDLEDDLRLVSFDIKWAIPGLEVSDIVGGRGYNHWEDVLKWVAENGWEIPVMSMVDVIEKYELTPPS